MNNMQVLPVFIVDAWEMNIHVFTKYEYDPWVT